MDGFITVSDLAKTYYIDERSPGMWGALRGVLHRRRRAVPALAGVSFTIGAGAIVGLLGPNGAGKSTAIKILAGILRPDAGTVTVAGRVPWRERRRHVAGIGVVFGQKSQLWWDLPVAESFTILGAIYRVDQGDLARRITDLAALLDLGDLMARPVRTLSLGQRMRCELAAALLHAPPLLFLDEPTIGLDAPAKLAVRSFIQDLNRRHGTTVLLTSHDLDEVETLCPRVLVIAGGRMLLDGSLADLRRRVAPAKRVTVDLSESAEPPKHDGLTVVEATARRWVLEIDPRRLPTPKLMAVLAEAPVVDLAIAEAPIEQVVARLYAEAA
ncbi:ABC transporter [Planctomycetota bacterium]|nr:ABC transporter [Planctomycetota bacterium]